MSILETIYCSQYYEMKRQGADPMRGRMAGTLLATALLMLALIGILMLMNHFSKTHFLNHFTHRAAYWLGGRGFGKIFGILWLFIVGGGLYVTYGKEERYREMMARWEYLPDSEMERALATTRKVSIAVFAGCALILVFCIFM